MTYEEMNAKWPFGNKPNGIAKIGWIICDETKWIFDICYNCSAEWLEKVNFVNKFPLIRNIKSFKRRMKRDEMTCILNLCSACNHMQYELLRIDPDLKMEDWITEIREEALKEERELYDFKELFD